jgi:catechol 2,3-dioxygenase-like lactoylglutathione lyase family enzyme
MRVWDQFLDLRKRDMAGGAKTKKKPPAKPVKAAARSAKPPAARPKAAAPAAKARPAPAPKRAGAAKPAPAPKAAPAARPAAVQAPPPPPPPGAPLPAPRAVPPVPARGQVVPAAGKGLQKGDFVLDKLAQVALTATNLDASVAFYRDVLGFRFLARFDPPGVAYFQIGSGARLQLSVTASQASLYFGVDSVDAAVAELKKRGVNFLHPPVMLQRDVNGELGRKGAEEWVAFFRDPAGNTLALVERR